MKKSSSKIKTSRQTHSKPRPPMMIGAEGNIFNRKEIIDKQNKLRKIFDSQRHNPQTQFYDKLKYHFIVYKLGEFIELFSTDPNITYIARLTRIIQVSEGHQPIFIEVEWVLRKEDLPLSLLAQCGQFISNSEVFPSEEKIYLYVESIKAKCTLLSLEEYGDLGLTSDSILFTRAGYDSEIKSIIPDPSTWKKDCICGRPTNPDLIYVACSKCGAWFHSDCVESKIINGHFMCEGCFANPFGFFK